MVQILQQFQAGQQLQPQANAGLVQAIAQQGEAMLQQRNQAGQQLRALREGMAAIAAGKAGVVDVREVGKPDQLKGKEGPDCERLGELVVHIHHVDQQPAREWRSALRAGSKPGTRNPRCRDRGGLRPDAWRQRRAGSSPA